MKQHLVFSAKCGGLAGDAILDLFHNALDASGAHIRRAVEYKFYPRGLTAVVILAESHAAIHTWPEDDEARVDYFSCDDSPDFEAFEDVFFRAGCSIFDKQILDR